MAPADARCRQPSSRTAAADSSKHTVPPGKYQSAHRAALAAWYASERGPVADGRTPVRLLRPVVCFKHDMKCLGRRLEVNVRGFITVRASADQCSARSGRSAGVDVAGRVADSPRSGEVEVEVVVGLAEHAGRRLPARAGAAAVAGHRAVWVVGAGVDPVEANAIRVEERPETFVHGLQSVRGEEAAGYPALVGDDDEGPARVLEGVQRWTDVRLENQVIGAGRVVAGFGQGAVAVEEHGLSAPTAARLGRGRARGSIGSHGHGTSRTARRRALRRNQPTRSVCAAGPCRARSCPGR